MSRLLSYATVRCCLHIRVAASDFMDYDVTLLLDEDTQAKISQDLIEISKLNAFYVKLFLSRYIKLLEQANLEINDTLYELLCLPQILGATPLPPTAIDTLQYVIDDENTTVKIKETPKIISGQGTTGLRTWEAALYLLSYINSSGEDSTGRISLEGSEIVELGAGTGLVSLAIAKKFKSHNFTSITVTDGDSALVEGIGATFAYNGIENVAVRSQQLLWGTTDPRDTENFVQAVPHADIVVAADVTYDALVVPQLAATLLDFFHDGTKTAYIAATVRNLDTIAAWEKSISGHFVWDVCAKCQDPHTEAATGWYRKGTPEIRIYRLVDVKRA